MKVVLLAGGLGTRMREETEFRPKPMVDIGGRPALWHIMKIFASYGHTDFLILGGYKINAIKSYFLNYEPMTMDFTRSFGPGSEIRLHGENSEADWTVTIVDTGADTPTGGRLYRAKRFLDDEAFFCSYGDSIADVNLSELLAVHRSARRPATVTVTPAPSRFGAVKADSSNLVTKFEEKKTSEVRVSIGFFVLEPSVLSMLAEDSVLETDLLTFLANKRKLGSFGHNGFWQPMDTHKELTVLQELWAGGNPPWKIW